MSDKRDTDRARVELERVDATWSAAIAAGRDVEQIVGRRCDRYSTGTESSSARFAILNALSIWDAYGLMFTPKSGADLFESLDCSSFCRRT